MSQAIIYEDRRKKLWLNGMLFCELRGYEELKTKLNNITFYLNMGADINALDANDSYNTPLHVAVEREEIDIVKLLLHHGANINAVNNEGKRPIHLANKSTEIIRLFSYDKTYGEIKTEQASELCVTTNHTSESIRENKVMNMDSMDKILTYQSRPGTAGIGGQLYETKLLALLLYRALNDPEISQFYLGTNLADIGAFDDIVFKYYLNNFSNPTAIFVQAKHRESSKKDEFTTEMVLKSDSDFDLGKYYESYLKIKTLILYKNNKNMFFSDINLLDCSFIIYTSAGENFKNKIIPSLTKNILYSDKSGKIFRFNFNKNDIITILENSMLLQTKSLAKYFASYISKNKYKNMLLDKQMKTYHVYLYQNVVNIIETYSKDYNIGKFRKSFLENNDKYLSIIKKTMVILLKKNDSKDLEDITFKIPKNFGNVSGIVTKEDLNYFCETMKNLLLLGKKTEHFLLIEIGNDSAYQNKQIKKKLLKIIGNLMGNLIIFDLETQLHKFNYEKSTSENLEHIIRALNMTKNEVSNIRININLRNVPKLAMVANKMEIKSCEDFLHNVLFYTNQKDEEGIEDILKREINEKNREERNQENSTYFIRNDAIYLKFHDMVQKWWKRSNIFLSKSCKFYADSKKVILDSPLLNIHSNVFIQKLTQIRFLYENDVIYNILQKFMANNQEKIIYVNTKHSFLTTLKVLQYLKIFKNNLNTIKCIDLDVVIAEKYDKLIFNGISETIEVIILCSRNIIQANEMIDHCITLSKKLIIISNNNAFKLDMLTYNSVNDVTVSLKNCTAETKHKISTESIVMLQGYKVPLFSFLTKDMEKYINGEILYNAASKIPIKIGQFPVDVEIYKKNQKFYIQRSLCRCIYLNKKHLHDFYILDTENNLPENIQLINDVSKDVLIISNENNMFEYACKEFKNNNIHWFAKNLLYLKSSGSINSIIPFVYRDHCLRDNCLTEFKTLKDVESKVVLISANAGMGKSTFVIDLLMQTKLNDNTICTLKINLLDLKTEFSTWKKHEVKSRLM